MLICRPMPAMDPPRISSGVLGRPYVVETTGSPSCTTPLSMSIEANSESVALVRPVSLARSARLIGFCARNKVSSVTDRLWLRRSS